MEEVECNGVTKNGTVISTPLVSDNSCSNAVPKLISVQGRMTGPTRRSKKGGWTEQEDKILAFAVEKFNGKNWKKIGAYDAEYVPYRTDVQCLHRWQKVLNPNLVKGPWSKQEDDLIIELVGKQGNKKWCEIAKFLPGRIGKQCRERWHNHLNPEIKKTPWTKEEELVLIKAHEIYGNRWAEIAKFLRGRTENSIKNHWNCSVKKKVDLYLARGSVLYNFETKAGNGKFEEAKQSLGTTFSLDQKMDSKSSDNTCSLDLALWNEPMKPPIGTLFDKKLATVSGLSNEQWKHSVNNAKMPGDSHHFTANGPNESCKTSLGDLLNPSLLQKDTQEIDNLTNPSPPRSLSGHLPPSSDTPFIVPGSNRRNNTLPHEQAHPDSCRRPEDYLCVNEKRKDAKMPHNLEDKNCGCLSFQHPHYYTSPSHDGKKFHSYSSPESILRSAARSFKNTPSIIRKRGLQTFRKTVNANHSDGISTSEEKIKSSNSPQSVQLYPCDKDEFGGVLPNVKQLFLSPLKSQKLEISVTNKSLEKRLEYAFDAEWDSTD